MQYNEIVHNTVQYKMIQINSHFFFFLGGGTFNKDDMTIVRVERSLYFLIFLFRNI